MGKVSKGCINCRKRKVKCDETRPHCDRCTRFGRICGGYGAVTFKDGLVKRARRANRSSSEPLRLPSHAGPDLPITPPCDVNREPLFTKSSDRQLRVLSAAHEASLNAIHPASYPEPSALNQLGLGAFQDEILISFTTGNLKFLGRNTAPNPSELDTLEGLLHFESILAVSTSYIASQHRDPTLTQLGIVRYRKCLNGVNQALRDPVRSKSIHTFGAVISLMLHEVIAPTNFDSWSHHMIGLQKLFYHCGPEAFMSGRGHRYFRDYRMYIICACLAVNKACLLDTTEWCTVPWALDPKSKTPFQYLLDIVVDIPTIIQPAYISAEPKDPQSDLTFISPDTHATLRTKLEAMERWEARWLSENAHDMRKVKVDYSCLPEECRPMLWETRYESNDLWTLQVYTTYLAFKSLLVATIRAIELLQPYCDEVSVSTLSQQRRQASIEICRCAEFTLCKTHRSAAAIMGGFCFRMAVMDFARTNSPESRWLAQLFRDAMGSTLGQYQEHSSIALATYKIRKWELRPET